MINKILHFFYNIKITENFVRLFLTVLPFLCLTSCYNYKSVGLLQENNHSLPQYEKQLYEDYKLCVNDEIVFRLITTDETISKLISSNSPRAGQQISYRVYPDGTIDIPFLSQIPVKGLTLNEATEVIQNRIREIIPDAEIKLSLANKSFTVIGDIGSGTFPIYKEKMTIFQALALSGDLQLSGDRKHVRILRNIEGKTNILEFDIRPASIVESKYYYIYPNDIIYVQRAPSSFYKVNNYNSFLGLITTSLTFLISVIYLLKL
ncbi:MAG TPA: polysaccharide biosynthesis/export family protein [Paludibacteraceae bacterium]|nr:polysaccharide biosynthesis/export family protein [Paludibacteraceae bacterium]